MEKQSPIKLEYNNQDFEIKKPMRLDEIFGMFRTVSAVPTGKPSKASDQIVIYISGATFRLYVYETTNKAWKYTTLT